MRWDGDASRGENPEIGFHGLGIGNLVFFHFLGAMDFGFLGFGFLVLGLGLGLGLNGRRMPSLDLAIYSSKWA